MTLGELLELVDGLDKTMETQILFEGSEPVELEDGDLLDIDDVTVSYGTLHLIVR